MDSNLSISGKKKSVLLVFSLWIFIPLSTPICIPAAFREFSNIHKILFLGNITQISFLATLLMVVHQGVSTLVTFKYTLLFDSEGIERRNVLEEYNWDVNFETFKFPGVFDTVYGGTDLTIKVYEDCEERNSEWNTFVKLKAHTYRPSISKHGAWEEGIQNVYGLGTLELHNKELYFIVMQRMKSNLEDYMKNLGYAAWVKTGYEMLRSQLYLENNYVVNGNLSPQSYMVNNNGKVFLRNFLCAQRNFKFMSMVKHAWMRSDPSYYAWNAGDGMTSDDEAFVYCFVYLKFPNLPWLQLANDLEKMYRQEAANTVEWKKSVKQLTFNMLEEKQKFDEFIQDQFDKVNIPEAFSQLVIKTLLLSQDRKRNNTDLRRLVSKWEAAYKKAANINVNFNLPSKTNSKLSLKNSNTVYGANT